MNWRITDPEHLLGAMRVSLCEGGEFLVGRIHPNGPILRKRSVSYIHKTSWGMYAAGIDHDIIARLLDWAENVALRDNGDFYFPEEVRVPPEPIDGSNTIFLPQEEITGEFLGELKAIERGVAARLKARA